MLILLPVSRSDRQLGIPLARHIKMLGGVTKHDLVLFYTGAEAQETAGEMAKILADTFKSVCVEDSGQTDEEGWPKSANLTFRQAALWVDRNGKVGPWYFFEADNVPLKACWADVLEEQYHVLGKPFMGVIHNTVWTSPEGVRTVDGTHMVGTGLYPAPFHRHSILYRFLNTTAFDVFLQNEIVPNAAHTDFIQHNWSTKNYRRQGTEIVCDAAEGRPGESLCAPVRPDAVVLHGCKDGSLIELFRKAEKSKGRK